MKELKDTLADLQIFKGLKPSYLELIAGCGKNARFNQGDHIFREGDAADYFYLLRHGRVALNIFVPHKGPVTLETINEGEVLGWSWLFPPYKWHYDARAIVLTRAVEFDAKCIRAKIEEDVGLGYELMKRFAAVMIERLQASRFQMLDIYGGRTEE